ncbi:MAG: hypothetical protein ACRDXX_04100 [Stackebrandtia sp.]
MSTMVPDVRVSETTLGWFSVAKRRIEVHRQGEKALWLYVVDNSGRAQSLGTVRWQAGVTPSLVFAPGCGGWVMSHSPLAESIVREAMAVFRREALGDHTDAHDVALVDFLHRDDTADRAVTASRTPNGADATQDTGSVMTTSHNKVAAAVPAQGALDQTVQDAADACGVVCLLVWLARCRWCQEPMKVKLDADDGAHYVCGFDGRGAHAIPVEVADEEAWNLHISTGSPALRNITDSRQKRRMIRQAYSAVVLDADAPSPVHARYPRPTL